MITFAGLASVADRTLFTNNGPIVKPALNLLGGIDLQIINPNQVKIPSGSFTSADIGLLIQITGSPAGRNDGSFFIRQVLNSVTLVLDNANFDNSVVAPTLDSVVLLANGIKKEFNQHVIFVGPHGTADTTNETPVVDAQDLPSALTLLNDIQTRFNAHIISLAHSPSVHRVVDVESTSYLPAATSLNSAILLANELRRNFERHRQDPIIHYVVDSIDIITVPPAKVVKNTLPSPNVGPFPWTLINPQIGQFADSPSDVVVRVNGTPVSVDAVFGLLGAVVLSVKPSNIDAVAIDYDWLQNPATSLLRLNSPEFHLNQDGLHNFCGLPGHFYRVRSFIINDQDNLQIASPFSAKQIGWRYKGLERAYTAALNDPNKLLLNVPSNKIEYPILDEFIPEVLVKYDPTTLPQNATDPWTYEGVGTLSIVNDELIVIDNDTFTGPASDPPFFTHMVNLEFPSIGSCAFRVYVTQYVADGVFTGVAFGLSDGKNVAVAGLIETLANNLSSAIVLVNALKASYNLHIVQTLVHAVNDSIDQVAIVDATDTQSLEILANAIKAEFNDHVVSVPVHTIVDTVNTVATPNAFNLATAVTLVNALTAAFNAHRIQIIGSIHVHQMDDIINIVHKVKQVGFLNNRGFQEFDTSWNSGAVDWSVDITYRIARDSNGDVSLFLSGQTTPFASALASELPSISDLDAKFDPVQQTFFGSISRPASSTSHWLFIRVQITPVDNRIIGDNKSVDYEAIVIPEQDPIAPWITIGQGGYEHVVANTLILDSTASTSDNTPLGLSSGAYRGFFRFEPTLTSQNTSIVEFRGSVDTWTFGVNDRAAGIFIDDNTFQVHLSFLQYSPQAATFTGSITEPFPVSNGDTISFSLDSNPHVFTTSVLATDSLASQIAIKINATPGVPAGFAMAVGGKVQLTSSTLGASSRIRIVGGSALFKIGLNVGTYFGSDSTPEPRISYFGEDLPNLDVPTWSVFGTQPARMLGRTLRISDSSNTDYLLYSLTNTLVTAPVLSPNVNWKIDFRTTVHSFTPSTSFITTFGFVPVQFAGMFVNIDEGLSGKQLEIQTAVDVSGNPYLNIVTFNIGPGAFIIVAQFPFTWNDGQIHTYDLYVDKATVPLNPTISLFVDGTFALSFLYNNLRTGIAGPAITFGSGAAPIGITNLASAQSVVDWHAIDAYKDSKLGDPTSASRRYVGVYQGGDTSVLASYAIAQIDWSVPHVYRVVRDPTTEVAVYIDNARTPTISISYDTLRLPPVFTSFLTPITSGQPVIAFGSFSSHEISRTRWVYVKYSIGRTSISNRIVPYRHLLNQSNAYASPDHLYTQIVHSHAGTKVYSGGTPNEELLSNPLMDSFTVLGDDTAPVPMTQDLNYRGGLSKTITIIDSVPTTGYFNQNGYLADFENDTVNTITISIAVDLPTSITLVNELRAKFSNHLSQYRVHINNDIKNVLVSPVAFDLTSAEILANEIKAKFNLHRVQIANDSGSLVHTVSDTFNIESAADASDLPTLIFLLNDLRIRFNAHLIQPSVHASTVIVQLVAPNRVVYEKTKFFPIETGDDHHTYPYYESSVVGTLVQTIPPGPTTIFVLV